MLRSLLTLAAAASAILWAASLLAWMYVVSGGRRLAVAFQRPDGRWELVAERGILRLDNWPQRKWEREDSERLQRLLTAAIGGVRDAADEIVRTRRENEVARRAGG